jgi:hypothetical protein
MNMLHPTILVAMAASLAAAAVVVPSGPASPIRQSIVTISPPILNSRPAICLLAAASHPTVYVTQPRVIAILRPKVVDRDIVREPAIIPPMPHLRVRPQMQLVPGK